ncbi:hypothetical protein, partial [Escherichia coli]|uniref:hypothetical protein n=1 Tax=Escherichia coli TaxID=562 RepID=UPI0019D5E84F
GTRSCSGAQADFMRLGMNRYLGWDDLSEPGRDLEIPLASDAVGREVDVGIIDLCCKLSELFAALVPDA